MSHEVEQVVEKIARGSREAKVKNDFLRTASLRGFGKVTQTDRLKTDWNIMKGYGEQAVEDGGFSSMWSMAGHHAIRGAVGGAAIGGTVSALNGGDFWDGAKAGAFKGATIYGGLRMGQAFTGAESLNPFAGKGKGAFSSMYNMHALTSNALNGKEVPVSRAAAKILAQRRGDGLTRGIMNVKNG